MTSLLSGWLTKRGETVKSWKVRWVELSGDGVMRYYKLKDKPAPSERLPKPAGEINIRYECIEIFTCEECSGVEWPPSTAPDTAFGLATATRVYFLFSKTPEECNAWLQECSKQAKHLRQDATRFHLLLTPTAGPSSAGPVPNPVTVSALPPANPYEQPTPAPTGGKIVYEQVVLGGAPAQPQAPPAQETASLYSQPIKRGKPASAAAPPPDAGSVEYASVTHEFAGRPVVAPAGEGRVNYASISFDSRAEHAKSQPAKPPLPASGSGAQLHAYENVTLPPPPPPARGAGRS